ncbi:unnamed protein product [Thlaspi arvense]|uniref:Thionin n=1 Tax=Thlaspi arvense TaxID=13288 RepID=A0AAU9RRM1_THLAR|nr:unnamed protein product [Thlaspi arvense]
MEGRTVILSALIMTLVMARIQVEAKICCPSASAKALYDICIRAFYGRTCLPKSGCKDEDPCPPGYPYDILKSSAQGDAVNEYCKLGCDFSMCGVMTTLQNSGANEIVNGAVVQCTKACSTICNKGSLTAVKSA